MDRGFDYRGTSQLLLWLGFLLSVAAPLLEWLAMLVAAVVCFVFAIICHTSHLAQEHARESLEIRKRLKAIEDQFGSSASPPHTDE